MKKYKCHKVVEAAPIVAAEFKEDGSGKVYTANEGSPNNRTLWIVPAGFKRPNTSPSMCVDGGDYLVRYDDGYLSWSPKAVFEAGYAQLIEADAPKPLPAAGVFRKRPVEVEAFQMTRERRADNSEWPAWMHAAWNETLGSKGSIYPSKYPFSDCMDRLVICTLEGQRVVGWGDYIIRGVKGELYPCKPDIFAATYEAA